MEKNENLKVMVVSLYTDHCQPIIVTDLPFVVMNRSTVIHPQMSCSLLPPLVSACKINPVCMLVSRDGPIPHF